MKKQSKTGLTGFDSTIRLVIGWLREVESLFFWDTILDTKNNIPSLSRSKNNGLVKFVFALH